MKYILKLNRYIMFIFLLFFLSFIINVNNVLANIVNNFNTFNPEAGVNFNNGDSFKVIGADVQCNVASGSANLNIGENVGNKAVAFHNEKDTTVDGVGLNIGDNVANKAVLVHNEKGTTVSNTVVNFGVLSANKVVGMHNEKGTTVKNNVTNFGIVSGNKFTLCENTYNYNCNYVGPTPKITFNDCFNRLSNCDAFNCTNNDKVDMTSMLYGRYYCCEQYVIDVEQYGFIDVCNSSKNFLTNRVKDLKDRRLSDLEHIITFDDCEKRIEQNGYGYCYNNINNKNINGTKLLITDAKDGIKYCINRYVDDINEMDFSIKNGFKFMKSGYCRTPCNGFFSCLFDKILSLFW